MEDKKVNINIGYEKLTQEEINSHKNFGKVYQTYVSTGVKPMKVAKKFPYTKLLIVATVSTVVTVGVWKYKSSSHQNGKTPATAKTSPSSTNKAVAKTHDSLKRKFIHPPLKGVDVPYMSYNVQSSKGGMFTYKKSKITIPANAFCDENGKDVSGDVKINYREFHDAIDFFVSGIPMTYDSAGKTYNFESAGMLDIQGTLNGKPVFIKPGKDIQIAMSSFQTGTKYNVYKLDTIQKNWAYQGKSNYKMEKAQKTVIKKQVNIAIQQFSAKDTIAVKQKIDVVKQEEKKLEAEKPLPPVKTNEQNYKCIIDVDSSEFPELAVYKNVKFEVDPSNKDYNPKWATTEWTDAKLTRKGSSEDYIFTVSKGNIKHDILVHPTFEGQDYKVALKEYNQKYAQYQTKLDKKIEEEKKQKEAYEKMMAEFKKKEAEESEKRLEIQKQNELLEAKNEKVRQENARLAAEYQEKNSRSIEKQKQLLEEEEARRLVQNNVINYLNIKQFGIINCDNPDMLPQGAQLIPTYVDDKKDNLNNTTVFMVRKDRNQIIEFYPGHYCNFNPLERNFAWAVTPDHKIAIYSEEEFSKINKTKGEFTFEMTVLNNAFASEDDVREALKPYMD